MAAFDTEDFAGRVVALLPRIWFSDAARRAGGRLYALACGLGAHLAFLYGQIQVLKANSRLLTTQDMGVLQAIAADLFGGVFPPTAGETVALYRQRILARLFLPGGTREGIRRAVYNVVGQNPILIEPWNVADCGAWDAGYAWDVNGRWADPTAAWTGFVKTVRPLNSSSNAQPVYAAWDAPAGWDSPIGEFFDPTPAQTIGDSVILSAINDAKPIGSTVWVQFYQPVIVDHWDDGAVWDDGGLWIDYPLAI